MHIISSIYSGISRKIKNTKNKRNIYYLLLIYAVHKSLNGAISEVLSKYRTFFLLYPDIIYANFKDYYFHNHTHLPLGSSTLMLKLLGLRVCGNRRSQKKGFFITTVKRRQRQEQRHGRRAPGRAAGERVVAPQRRPCPARSCTG